MPQIFGPACRGLLIVLATMALIPAAAAPLSLRQAVETAWSRQPYARSLDSRRAQAEAQTRAAGSWTPEPPAVELSLKTDRPASNLGNREIVAGVSAPLWLPEERQRTLAAAQAGQAALESRLAAEEWKTAGAVREAWWAAHLAQVDLSLAQARLEYALELSRDTAQRVKNGDLARADQNQAEGGVAAARAELSMATAALSQACQALRAWTGLLPDELPGTPESVPTLPVAAPHPLLRELNDQLATQRHARELAQVQWRAHPELTLAATRERSNFGEAYGQALNVGLRIPLGADDRAQARIAAATAEEIEAQTRLDTEGERLAAEAQSAQQRWHNAKEAAQATAQRATLALENRGHHEKSFRLGQTDLRTRQRADLEAFEAQRQAARAGIEMSRALSSWRQTLGLTPD